VIDIRPSVLDPKEFRATEHVANPSGLKRMKLAFIVAGFSADETDWCIPADTELIRALAAWHEVHVFTLRYPHRVDTYRIGQATVHSFNGVGSRGINTVRLWLTALRAVQQEDARGRFDLIHSIFGSEAGCLTVLAAQWLRLPSVVWLVNGELVGLRDIGYGADLFLRQRWMNSIALWFATRIFCGCTFMTTRARARVSPARWARIETVPLVVNTIRFAPNSSVARGGAHFINVASLSPVKDQAALLHVFTRVLSDLPEARLTIAGEGVLETELCALAQSLGIDNRVMFAGKIPHDQLPALYHSADVFIQTSRHEGQGMALLEAAACGCAVCGTTVGALADLAERGAALTAPVGDMDALVDVVKRTWERRTMYGAHAQEIVHREYNLEHICARVLDEYARLAAPSGTVHDIQPLADP